VGSVFSPYYAWARRRGRADPDDHCALNVALYGRSGHRWALTERGRRALRREPDALGIGPSGLRWDGSALVVDLCEVTVPVPSRIRGRVRLIPEAWCDRSFALDAAGLHRWWPAAPCSRVEVDLERPALRWRGRAYLDTNAGDEPLEAGFVRWDWSRGALPDGGTAVLYDVERRTGDDLTLALRFAPDGGVAPFSPPPRAALPGTGWRVRRATRADAGHAPSVRQTLEDTPFYARSLLATHLLGKPVEAVHESLSLDRFASPWVQLLLPFRMPRRGR